MDEQGMRFVGAARLLALSLLCVALAIGIARAEEVSTTSILSTAVTPTPA